MFKSNAKNVVEIEGYIKENTLAYDKENSEVIKGHITVIVEEGQEYRIQYYSNRMKKSVDGKPAQENKMFSQIEKVLDENTTSLEKILKVDSTATFETAKDSLTKVICRGNMQEFLRKDRDGTFAPLVTIKGMNAFVRDAEKFAPRANFEVEVYVDQIRPEVKDGEETGRVILLGLAPEYNAGVSEIEFIANTEDAGGMTFADYISNNYEVGDTIVLTGDLVSVVKKKQNGTKTTYKGFTKVEEPVYITEFVNERVIYGGTPADLVLKQGDKDCFSREDIKEARAVREKKIGELDNQSNTQKRGFGAPANAPKKPKINF